MAAVERAMPAFESGLMDLSGVSLQALRSLDGPALSESLRRLLEDVDDPHALTVAGVSPGGGGGVAEK
ncbi:FXSXX-COOH protein [Streptomyces griseochromogenes]|uniref:FXSXX-COOH protein n=1 Tax=Streptomyces griseochromogenes TaxID=68214 RepID=A0ABS4LWY7_9ACTN|nr:FXSXX-COOH protein [Streptomyces griseochromogenes]